MTDRIELKGIRALGTIGVLPEEKTRAQPFEVDVFIEADLSTAGESDDLLDTINYGEITEIVTRVINEEPHQLLERVARRLTEVILSNPKVDAVEVILRKLVAKQVDFFFPLKIHLHYFFFLMLKHLWLIDILPKDLKSS